jgi:hypothetical protein
MLDRSAKDKVCSAILREDLVKLALDLGNIEASLGKERSARELAPWLPKMPTASLIYRGGN